MPRLKDQLEELARRGDAVAPPTGLWDRGRRYGRRRRLGTMAITTVAAVAVLAVLTTGWLQSRTPEIPVAAESGELALPDRFSLPSPWLPTAYDPPGPLTALIPAFQSSFWGSERTSLVGVLGTTGEYRFLDLPDLAPGSDGFGPGLVQAVLSADGRRVAYWYEGDTLDEPVRDGPAIAGVAVYDTVTGDVTRRGILTPHGIYSGTLVWSGDRLWVSWFVATSPEGDGGDSVGTIVWTPDTGEEGSDAALFDLESTTATGDGLLATSARAVIEITLDGDEVGVTRQRRELSRPVTGAAYLSPDGRRIAVLADRDGKSNVDTGKPSGLLVGRLGEPGSTVQLRRVGAGTFNEVVGWRDDGQVVASATAPVDGGAPADRRIVLASADLVSGETTVLSDVGVSDYGLEVAQDALASPTYDAPEPATPLNPRWTAGLVAAAVLAGSAGALLWRRRVRP